MFVTFEVIGCGQHQDSLSEDFTSATWDPESKIKANSFFLSITEFEFIIVFLIIYQFLSHLAGITVKLQGTEVDIMEAYNQIDDIKSYYKTIRENINIEFIKVKSEWVRV